MGLGIFKGSRERERARSFFFRVLILTHIVKEIF